MKVREILIELGARATKLAFTNNQMVGKDNYYYITLGQLTDIIRDLSEEDEK